MLRIDIIFSSNQKEMMPPGIFEALEKEIDRKLRAQYQDMNVRIAWGTNAAMSATGGKNDKDNKKIKEMLQEILEDDGWVPEVEGTSDDVEYFDK
ncbi:DinI-like family protein [Morganella morganii]|uniref:DinI-like family protein n=1 Tax=Morganella morganii TaxID=582 RepID=UPI000D1E7BED|nr:DinI-like family protein [Morganella morganii]QXO42221.1 DinI-like family protein [Morganella morganii]QXO45853.1 DinI-like family protein [Morganella morganii]QXO49522.1 DinI-like family protein [Morganella morganii]QXO53383.1 DinI-like family protein [Morganella morganii]QXO80022.1 DinI-like family protein [Morganella morganii]